MRHTRGRDQTKRTTCVKLCDIFTQNARSLMRIRGLELGHAGFWRQPALIQSAFNPFSGKKKTNLSVMGITINNQLWCSSIYIFIFDYQYRYFFIR